MVIRRMVWGLGLGAVTAMLSLAATASAQPAVPPLSQCINRASGTSWTAYDDHQILVRSNGSTYLVTTDSCPRLADPLTHIVVVGAAGTPICGPHDVRLYVAADRIRTPCTIQSIKPLTSDEARAFEHGRR